MEIGPLVPKKIFKAFYHICARKPSGHVTKIILTYFHFHVPKNVHTKFGKKVKWFLRKTSSNFYMKMALGQSHQNALTLNT